MMERIVRVAIDLERRSGRVYQGEWLASVAQSHTEILVLHLSLWSHRAANLDAEKDCNGLVESWKRNRQVQLTSTAWNRHETDTSRSLPHCY